MKIVLSSEIVNQTCFFFCFSYFLEQKKITSYIEADNALQKATHGPNFLDRFETRSRGATLNEYNIHTFIHVQHLGKGKEIHPKKKLQNQTHKSDETS